MAGRVTPPHYPTFKVRFSDDTIHSIVSEAFPNANAEKIEQLASGKSFNNRIYFVTVTKLGHVVNVDDQNSTSAEDKLELVLKVSGQFFGPLKVQKEVSCLLVLQKHCPSIPVPRVIAWSESGLDLHICHDDSRSDSTECGIKGTRGRGWILMTRMPGRLLTAADLARPDSSCLISELATHVSNWRQNLPRTSALGNLRLLYDTADITPESEPYNSPSSTTPGSHISGLLLATTQPVQDLSSAESYYKHQLMDRVAILDSEPIFTPNRDKLSTRLKSFAETTLAQLPLFTSAATESPTFTHYDLSPRNILITESSPALISGIVDFEFAGFFPAEQEFTATLVNSAFDWPGDTYDQFQQELANHNIATPLRGMDQATFEQACVLCRLTQNVAPWWLRAGGLQDEELAGRLEKAALQVTTAIEDLERCVENASE
jgi:hypothetical protein